MSVAECVAHFYADDDGKRWWWHCLTCDDGSNKHGRHRRGHKRESDAKCGMEQHCRQMRANRQADEDYRVWNSAIMSTTDPDEFVRLLTERFGWVKLRDDLTHEEMMLYWQGSDEFGTWDAGRALPIMDRSAL